MSLFATKKYIPIFVKLFLDNSNTECPSFQFIQMGDMSQLLEQLLS